MKKAFAKVLCLVLCMTIMAVVTVVSAAEGGEIMPRFVGIDAQVANLTINEYGRASCGCSVLIDTGYSVDVTMTLEQDGSAIKSWTGSGSSGSRVDLSKAYYVTKGHDYQVIVTTRVSTSGGSYLCTYTEESPVKSY